MRGAFPPVDLHVVCFVLAIVQLLMSLFFWCSCVCVCFVVRCSTHGKKKESVMTPNFNDENLNHPFTGTTLHTVTSKSTPETIEGYRQFCSFSVFAVSHGRFVAF
jgi:hypothetical protein